MILPLYESHYHVFILYNYVIFIVILTRIFPVFFFFFYLFYFIFWYIFHFLPPTSARYENKLIYFINVYDSWSTYWWVYYVPVVLIDKKKKNNLVDVRRVSQICCKMVVCWEKRMLLSKNKHYRSSIITIFIKLMYSVQKLIGYVMTRDSHHSAIGFSLFILK